MQIENKDGASVSKFGTGIKFGIITAVVYVLLLLIQYMFCGGSPVTFTAAKIMGFVIIIGCFILAAIARRKELGGFAELKELFQTIFIVIIFAELAFVIFSFIYLNFIDPMFMERYTQTVLVFLEDKKAGIPKDTYDEQIKALADAKTDHKSIVGFLRQFVNSIVLDSVIGLIIAFAIKRKRPENGYSL